MLTYCFEIAKEGASKVTLEAMPNAYQFYKQFGFKKIEGSYTIRSGIKLEVIKMEIEVSKKNQL